MLKVIQKKDIDEVRVQEKSLMPEGFGSNIKIQEFRDLIRYVMAHPFITEVRLFVEKSPDAWEKQAPIVGVPGRIPIPDGDMNLYIQAAVTAPEGAEDEAAARHSRRLHRSDRQQEIHGQRERADAQPDQVAIDVELAKGENQITIEFHSKGKSEAVYARFHDPDRKLSYPEPPEPKK